MASLVSSTPFSRPRPYPDAGSGARPALCWTRREGPRLLRLRCIGDRVTKLDSVMRAAETPPAQRQSLDLTYRATLNHISGGKVKGQDRTRW